MGTKFTPGPWHVDGARIRNAASTLIATSAYLRHLRSQETEAANALLIAAAPDLLQELRNIANADTLEWDDRTEFEAWAKSRARAAIAKALGD